MYALHQAIDVAGLQHEYNKKLCASPMHALMHYAMCAEGRVVLYIVVVCHLLPCDMSFVANKQPQRLRYIDGFG